MTSLHRRAFCADVGRGVLAASVGTTFALDLGLGTVQADEKPKELTFGKLEPLVCLMQETPPAKLLPILVKHLQDGTDLKELVSAAALANARLFGGEDYVGFHTMMALAPAYHMSQELPAEQRALPILKVLHRNAQRSQEMGGRKAEAMRLVEATTRQPSEHNGTKLLGAVRAKEMNKAEAIFAGIHTAGPDTALDELLIAVEDCLDVHRIVLPYRSWDLLSVVGKDHAHTLLRQSVRFCVKHENPRYSSHYESARKGLTDWLEKALKRGERLATPAATDAWLEKFADTIFRAKPNDAAQAAADALHAGFAPESIGEAITLASNQLVLRDSGRRANEASPNKPVGSIHGDSIGVHACDSANAWRNLAHFAGPRNKAACLILGAWQVAYDRVSRGGDFLTWQPYPRDDARNRIKGTDAKTLLEEAEDAIKHKDQPLVTAAIAAYGEKKLPERDVFDLLLKYAVSEDGALHAEKFYRTTVEEFRSSRPAFRWRYLIALARVTASAYGQPAPGYAEAKRMLRL